MGDIILVICLFVCHYVTSIVLMHMKILLLNFLQENNLIERVYYIQTGLLSFTILQLSFSNLLIN